MTNPTSGARRALLLVLATLAFVLVLAAPGVAAAEGAWHRTGDGVMRTRVAFIHVDVFAVGHEMKCVPDHKSKAEVAAADCDKRFVWRALRNVDKEDVRDSLLQGYQAVEYRDAAKIERALSIVGSGIREGESITIAYDAATRRTTFSQGRGKVEVEGLAFMRATWSVVFANREMTELAAALIRKL